MSSPTSQSPTARKQVRTSVSRIQAADREAWNTPHSPTRSPEVKAQKVEFYNASPKIVEDAGEKYGFKLELNMLEECIANATEPVTAK